MLLKLTLLLKLQILKKMQNEINKLGNHRNNTELQKGVNKMKTHWYKQFCGIVFALALLVQLLPWTAVPVNAWGELKLSSTAINCPWLSISQRLSQPVAKKKEAVNRSLQHQ